MDGDGKAGCASDGNIQSSMANLASTYRNQGRWTEAEKLGVQVMEIRTSGNSLPVLAIVGHWLTEKFEYRQKILEFTELQGAHSGENLAATVETCLVELDLVSKLGNWRQSRSNGFRFVQPAFGANSTPGEARNGPALQRLRQLHPLPSPYH